MSTVKNKAQEFQEDPIEALNKTLMAMQRGSNDSLQEERVKLRDFAAQLREVKPTRTVSPANLADPSYRVTPTLDYPHQTVKLPTNEAGTHLSKDSHKELVDLLRKAGNSPDMGRREAATAQAANVIAKDFDKKNQIPEDKRSALSMARQEIRAQVVMATRDIASMAGLNETQSAIVGYSLARQLEKEGFRVALNSAVDAISGGYKATSASAASSVGLRHAAHEKMNSAVESMAKAGFTRDNIKEAINKHAGKVYLAFEVYQNPEVARYAMQIAANSDKVIDGVMAVTKDSELRKAVGTVTLAAGEQIGSLHRGAGSVAVLAGAAMRGEGTEGMARHALRAAFSIGGGIAGAALAGGASFGAGAFVGGALGATAGSKLADIAIDAFDRMTGYDSKGVGDKLKDGEATDSLKLIAERATGAVASEAKTAVAKAENSHDLEREMSLGKAKG